MAIEMSGRSVIVTGAASGLGRAVARRFVLAGASVMMADADHDRLEREVAGLAAPGDEGRVQAFFGDLSEKLSMTNLMAATIDAYDGIDVLVNASRILVASDPLNPEGNHFAATLAQNVTSTFRISQIAARRMVELGRGETGSADRAIINLSSVHAHRSSPNLLAYSVSCAAVEQLTRMLALTLAPHGIRVNAVAAGGIAGHAFLEAAGDAEDATEALTEVTPMGRIAEPTECAEAILFLASPAAGFVTGQILGVDGGRPLLDPFSVRRG